MMIKSIIDMSRPHMLYAAGVGLIMLFSLATSNIPALAFSNYLDFPFRRQVCAGLFLTGALFGAFSIYRHMARSKSPWKVPQSQIAIPYVMFFVTTLIAIAIAR